MIETQTQLSIRETSGKLTSLAQRSPLLTADGKDISCENIPMDCCR